MRVKFKKNRTSRFFLNFENTRFRKFKKIDCYNFFKKNSYLKELNFSFMRVENKKEIAKQIQKMQERMQKYDLFEITL